MGGRRDGPSLMGDVAVHGRQVVAAEHLTSAASLYASQATARPGICLGCGGRLALYHGPGRVLDRVAPTYKDTHSRRAEFLRLSAAHGDTRAGDGIARFFPRGGSQFPWVLPGHSGAKGERPGRHSDCGPADFTWTQPDAGVLMAHSAVVLFLRRDVRGDGLLHEVDSPERRGSQHWPPDLLHPR